MALSRAEVIAMREAWYRFGLMAIKNRCESLDQGEYFSINTVRTEIVAAVGDPLHHNHWGCLISKAVAAGYIKRHEGTYVSAKHKAAHGHKVCCYEVLIGKGV